MTLNNFDMCLSLTFHSFAANFLTVFSVPYVKSTFSTIVLQFLLLITFNKNEKNQWVFVKHYSMTPAATKSKKAIFSFKFKVKVTRVIDLGDN